ncbi:IS66 family transposase [Acrocarpospora sp. B8E8]|uniref:IS66 family transposase n=1 Tax=Acrocarpospora sp. B8E8 TaxID=3153572 RepID=UPI00325E7305
MIEESASSSAPSMEEFARHLAAVREELSAVRAESETVRQVNTRLRELLAEREAELAVAREQIARQAEIIAVQAAEIKQLRELVAELQKRLGIDSNNSGTPPSAEKVWDRKKRADEKKDGSAGSRGVYGPKRPPGGQRGHEGTRMEMSASPDRAETMPAPDRCGGCAADLDHSADAGFVRAQVTELPQVKPETVEYRMPVRRCGCGHATTAAAPEGVQAGQACYGPNVKTMTALIAEIGHASMERTAMLMRLMFGVSVSTGFVAKVDAQLAKRLAGFEEQVKAHLRKAEVAGTDETPVSLSGKTAYIYGMHDGKVVWYGAGATRGHTTIKGFGLLTGFTGILVRDDYVGYHFLDSLLAGVQICLAHIVRDLRRIHDNDPVRGAWAGRLRTLSQEAIHTANQAVRDGEDALKPEVIADIRARYLDLAEQGVKLNPYHAGRGKNQARVLAERLISRVDKTLLFLNDLRIGATNNGSERILRRAKTQMKISGCWRSMGGLQAFCRVHTYLVTATNHGIDAFHALRDAFLGNPWTLSQATA